MRQKYFFSFSTIFLTGMLLLLSNGLLLAQPAPPTKNPEQLLRDKEAREALASAPGDLVKRVDEAPAAATKKEIELGKKATKQVEKDKTIKIVDPKKDKKFAADYKKLNEMAKKLGAVSGRPKIKYKVTLIKGKELNAFTLPDGNIYFYTGLLKTLYSDDEIAAVMAHEIGHNVGMHALRGQGKSSTVSLLNLAVLLAALTSGSEDAGKAVLFSQYLSVGLMNQYSEKYESEADMIGVATLIKAGYNPSAMVTVMKRFAAQDSRHPSYNPGIFQSHPEPTDRANAIIKGIKAAGLTYNPRAVNGTAGAKMVKGKDGTEVQFRKYVLMTFPGKNDATQKRAQNIANTLNDLLKQNLHYYEIKVRADGQNAVIGARGITIATVTPEDAKPHKLSTLKYATKWRNNMGRLFWHETLAGGL